MRFRPRTSARVPTLRALRAVVTGCLIAGCARGLEPDDARSVRRDGQQNGDTQMIEMPVDDIGEYDAQQDPDVIKELDADPGFEDVASPDAGCEADPARDCTPGEVQPCGSCGTHTCTAACVFGACTGSGTCTPGATQGCGRCGTQTCSGTCGWSACAGEGACMPGQTRACGNCGTQTCTASCQWGTCSGEGACAPGATRAGSCDPCSHQVCNSSCAWAACSLRPGNACEYRAGVNARSCSACMCGRQWCLSSCQWSTACTSCCSTCGGCL